jgi:putative methionine-R-sulfoxide reductase with GAF domain
LETGCGWLGAYQARPVDAGLGLVKLAYIGKPSRAVFPLTEEFATHSNNSTVGLSGRAKLIEDVGDYLRQGGAYYTCDAQVQSEACLPVYDAAGKVIGIIDAEDERSNFFDTAALARLVALCLVLPDCFPAL